MRSIRVTKPHMGTLDRERLPLSAFGALSQAFAEELLARAEPGEGLYPHVPLDLLEEGEEQPLPPNQINQTYQLNIQVMLEALRQEQDTVQRQAMERLLERVIRIREGRDKKETAQPSQTNLHIHQHMHQTIFQQLSAADVASASPGKPGQLGRTAERFSRQLQAAREGREFAHPAERQTAAGDSKATPAEQTAAAQARTAQTQTAQTPEGQTALQPQALLTRQGAFEELTLPETAAETPTIREALQEAAQAAARRGQTVLDRAAQQAHQELETLRKERQALAEDLAHQPETDPSDRRRGPQGDASRDGGTHRPAPAQGDGETARETATRRTQAGRPQEEEIIPAADRPAASGLTSTTGKTVPPAGLTPAARDIRLTGQTQAAEMEASAQPQTATLLDRPEELIHRTEEAPEASGQDRLSPKKTPAAQREPTAQQAEKTHRADASQPPAAKETPAKQQRTRTSQTAAEAAGEGTETRQRQGPLAREAASQPEIARGTASPRGTAQDAARETATQETAAQLEALRPGKPLTPAVRDIRVGSETPVPSQAAETAADPVTQAALDAAQAPELVHRTGEGPDAAPGEAEIPPSRRGKKSSKRSAQQDRTTDPEVSPEELAGKKAASAAARPAAQEAAPQSAQTRTGPQEPAAPAKHTESETAEPLARKAAPTGLPQTVRDIRTGRGTAQTVTGETLLGESATADVTRTEATSPLSGLTPEELAYREAADLPPESGATAARPRTGTPLPTAQAAEPPAQTSTRPGRAAEAGSDESSPGEKARRDALPPTAGTRPGTAHPAAAARQDAPRLPAEELTYLQETGGEGSHQAPAHQGKPAQAARQARQSGQTVQAAKQAHRPGQTVQPGKAQSKAGRPGETEGTPPASRRGRLAQTARQAQRPGEVPLVARDIRMNGQPPAAESAAAPSTAQSAAVQAAKGKAPSQTQTFPVEGEELTYRQTAETAAPPPVPEHIVSQQAESEYVRQLPDWARRFLKESAGEASTAPAAMGVARDITTLPAPAAEEEVRWTAPTYAQPAPVTYREVEKPHQETPPQTAPKISQAELERAADQVYRIIEDRIRRERRRLGL